MDLRGRYLILSGGSDGSRRQDISHLIAAGGAHLSTVTERDDPEALNGYHTKVTVLSSMDCFLGNRGKFDFKVTLWRDAMRDCARRCELAMERGVSIIVIDDQHSEKWMVQPYLTLADRYKYEVISFRMNDQRNLGRESMVKHKGNPMPLKEEWNLVDGDGDHVQDPAVISALTGFVMEDVEPETLVEETSYDGMTTIVITAVRPDSTYHPQRYEVGLKKALGVKMTEAKNILADLWGENEYVKSVPIKDLKKILNTLESQGFSVEVRDV